MKKIFTIALALGLFLGFSCTEDQLIDPANSNEQNSKVDDETQNEESEEEETTNDEEETELDPGGLDGAWSDPIRFTSYDIVFGAEGGTYINVAEEKENVEFWWKLASGARVSSDGESYEWWLAYDSEKYTADQIVTPYILTPGRFGELDKETTPSDYLLENEFLEAQFDFVHIEKISYYELAFTVDPNETTQVRKFEVHFTAGDYGGFIYLTQEAAE